MEKIHLALMKWCERDEPVCAGRNRRKVESAALRMLKAEHGSGPVDRGQAMCSLRITRRDIEIVELPSIE